MFKLKSCNVATSCASCFGGGETESYVDWQFASILIVLCRSQMPRKIATVGKRPEPLD